MNKVSTKKMLTVVSLIIVIFLMGVGITLLFMYVSRDKTIEIDGTIKDAHYDMQVGDTFEFTASDKPSVGIIQQEPVFNADVVKYSGKSVNNQSNLSPGMTGGDLYVNTYQFEVVGKGATQVELPMDYRGEVGESSVRFVVEVD